MFNQWAIKLSDFFIKEQIIAAEDREVYSYCFEILFSETVIYSLLAVIGLITHTFGQTVIYFAGFLLIRSAAGGFHAKTHWFCITLTVLVYGSSLLVMTFTPLTYKLPVIVVLLMLSVFNIFSCAPIDNINKPFSEREKILYKKKSRYLIVLTGGVILAAALAGPDILRVWAFAAALGIFCASFSVVLPVCEKIRHKT